MAELELDQLELPVSGKPFTISMKGIDIAAQEWGNPKGQPVLALHGWLDNSASYEWLAPAIAAMSDDFRIVAVDLPGHGLSGHWPEYHHYHLWAGVEDIEHIVDALGWDRFHLLGHSMGAAISVLYAGTFPNRLMSLAMIEAIGPMSGSIDEVPDRLADAILKMKAHQPAQKFHPNKDQFIEARMSGMIKLKRPASEAIISRSLISEENGFAWRNDKRVMLPSMMRLPEKVVQSFLKKITAPTWGLYAEDGMLGQQSAKETMLDPRWACISSKKELHWMTGGHHLHMEGDVPSISKSLLAFWQKS